MSSHRPAFRLAAGIVALVAGHASGEAPSNQGLSPIDIGDEAAPVFQTYDREDGLGEEIWSTVGFDTDGFVWAGSASSLARFDGYRWVMWPFDEARSLVRDMNTDSEGRLWAVFEGEGLARLGEGTWRIDPSIPDFVHAVPRTQGFWNTTELWAAHSRGLSRLRSDRWTQGPGDAEALHAFALAHTTELLGRPLQWVSRGAGAGLWYRERLPGDAFGPWQPFPSDTVRAMPLNALATSRNRGREELWILSYGAGIARLDAEGLRFWRAVPHCSGRETRDDRLAPGCRAAELPTEAIYWALPTTTGTGERLLWLATRAGLLRLREDDSVEIFDRRHGLPSDAVRGIKLRQVDGIDMLWLATEGGMARAALTDSQWRTVSLLGARENGIMGVLLEPDGRGGERLWVGSAREGVRMLEDGQWRAFSIEAGNLPVPGTVGLWRVPGIDGTDWRLASANGGMLFRIDDAFAFRRLDVPWPERHDDSVMFVLARQGASGRELWFANAVSGIHRLDSAGWRSFPAPWPTGWGRAQHLAEQTGPDGRRWIWASGERGLARFDGSRFEAVALPVDHPSEGLRRIALIERQARVEFWVGSNRHGLLRFDANDPSNLRALDDDAVPAAPDATVYGALADSRGRIYVCTNNGVQQLSPRDDGSYEERVFRRRDGLVHDECNTNGQWIDSSDRFWVGTLGGLSVFDPGLRQQARQSSVKPLRLTSLQIDGRHAHDRVADTMEISAGTRELRFEFALLAGWREAESRYRSRLVGYEPDFTPWSSARERGFSNLAPGGYTLHIEAVDHAEVVAEPLRIELRVAAFWWQRTWVHVLFAAAGVLGLIAVVMAYNRGLRQRERQLRRVVAERTAEITTANKRLTELSYQDPLTGVSNRRRLTDALESELARAIEHGRPIGLIILDVDHFKQYNDRHGHLAGDVALKAVAQAMVSATRKRDLVARFGGEEFACLLVDAESATVTDIAERMRALIQALPPRALGNDEQTLTASLGTLCVTPEPGCSAADLLQRCDAALYQAKAEGRNCVRHATAP